MSASPVYFGAGEWVNRKRDAVAELLPWKAPDERLVLAGERVEYLGDGVYSVTRSIKNIGKDTVRFNDEIRERDIFREERYLIPCVNYNGNEFGDVKTPKGLTLSSDILAPWPSAFRMWSVERMHKLEEKDNSN